MARWTRERALADAETALSTAGARAVLLPGSPDRPLIELLVPPADAASAIAALDALPWRWRYDLTGQAVAQPPVTWMFDGGVYVVLRTALPSAPMLPGALRALTRRLLEHADGPGVRAAPAELQLVHAAAQAARTGLRYRQLLDDVAALVRRPDAAEWPRVAESTGLARPVRRAVLAASGGEPGSAGVAARAGRLLDAVATRGLPKRLARRRRAEPLAATVVRCRFDGIELLAGPGVFLPRAASEPLVEAALEALEGRPNDARLVDVGTGCGAVPLAVARRRPGTTVMATELDAGAVRWARRNADRLGVPMRVYQGSLLEPVPQELAGTVDVVCGNVPCVPAADFSAAADAAAPAYVGQGDDGLGLHRSVAVTARDVLAPGGVLALQLSPTQWQTLLPELVALGYESRRSAVGDCVSVVGSVAWRGA